MHTKIYEKIKIKSLIVDKFKRFIRIKVRGIHKDHTSLCKPAWYIMELGDEKWPKEYTEIRNTNDTNVKIDPQTRTIPVTKDMKESKEVLGYEFEYFSEWVMHALTVEKIKKTYNNQFFEFLGDGVLAIFLAWHLVLHNPTSKDLDVDKLRIEASSSKKLFEIATNSNNYFEDYLIQPGYKLLEFFVPPVSAYEF